MKFENRLYSKIQILADRRFFIGGTFFDPPWMFFVLSLPAMGITKMQAVIIGRGNITSKIEKQMQDVLSFDIFKAFSCF